MAGAAGHFTSFELRLEYVRRITKYPKSMATSFELRVEYVRRHNEISKKYEQ